MGVDIGGSGIKGAPVNVETGRQISSRKRISTPHPATPEAVVQTVKEIVDHFDCDGPLGVCFPAIIKHGVAFSAANVDDRWIGTNGAALIAEACGKPVEFLNDADAAGLAEMQYGAGRDKSGVVIVLTLGTGIGSSIFNDDVLLPNSELGHLEFRGDDAEHYASNRVRTEDDLSWKKWGRRVNRVLKHYEFIFSPDLFILGGGVSKKFDKFRKHITIETETVPAQLRNEAGIVGSALAAYERL